MLEDNMYNNNRVIPILKYVPSCIHVAEQYIIYADHVPAILVKCSLVLCVLFISTCVLEGNKGYWINSWCSKHVILFNYSNNPLLVTDETR